MEKYFKNTIRKTRKEEKKGKKKKGQNVSFELILKLECAGTQSHAFFLAGKVLANGSQKPAKLKPPLCLRSQKTHWAV